MTMSLITVSQKFQNISYNTDDIIVINHKRYLEVLECFYEAVQYYIKLTINLFDVLLPFQENEVSYAKKSFHRVEYLTCTVNYEQYEDRPNIIPLIIWRSILRKEN